MTERLHFHFSLLCTGEGNGNPLQCSCLENPRDRRAWWAAVYGVAQSRTRLKWLSRSITVEKVTLNYHLWSHGSTALDNSTTCLTRSSSPKLVTEMSLLFMHLGVATVSDDYPPFCCKCSLSISWAADNSLQTGVYLWTILGEALGSSSASY